MKKLLLLFILLVFTVDAEGQDAEPVNEGIRFENTQNWNEITAKARTENKLIFVYVWASWCGPCKKLATEIFTQKEIGEFFNDHFINYSLQTDAEGMEDLPDKEYFQRQYRRFHQKTRRTYRQGFIIAGSSAFRKIHFA